MPQSRTRRDLLRTASGAVAGGALLSSGAGRGSGQEQPDENWPQFGFDTRNSGAPAKHTAPAEPVAVRWTAETESLVQSPPLVVDGTVYAGSIDDHVYAFDIRTGAEQWAVDTGGLVHSLAVVDGTVYAGNNANTIRALSAADGTEQWVVETGGMVQSSPTVANGTVYVGSGDQNLYALDTADGSERWRYRMDARIDSTPAVADGAVYVGGRSGVLVAVDATSGDGVWRFETENGVNVAPTVVDDTVYVGDNDGYLYAVSRTEGTEQWRFQTADTVFASPAIDDETVYVASSDSRVYALNASDGAKRWAFETDERITFTPALADGVLHVVSGRSLYAVDATDGTTRWSMQFQDAVSGPPTVANGTVYLGAGDGLAAVAGENSTIKTPTPSPTRTEQPSSQSPGIPPVAVGAGVLGLGGGGAWLLTKRRGDDTGDPGDDPSTAGEPGTADSTSKPPSTTGTDPQPPESDPRGSAVEVDAAVPSDIPSAPDRSVDYDRLTDMEPIGSGGNADVMRATLPTDDGAVPLAIKQPRMGGTIHTEAVERLLAEAETWDKLDDHDHIVDVVDYGAEPLPWIAMEYMDGGHLGQRIEAMDPRQKLWTAVAVSDAVHHAHQRGVAHLDLKPENILLRTTGDRWDVPKVADWGLSKHLLRHSKSVEGLSPHYAAPEQFDEEYGRTDDRTDIYQLGAVFYELFTGQPPFEGSPTAVMQSVLHEQPTPPSEIADLPPALDEILLTALAKQKAERYEAVIYLRDAFATLLDQS